MGSLIKRHNDVFRTQLISESFRRDLSFDPWSLDSKWILDFVNFHVGSWILLFLVINVFALLPLV